MAVKLSDHPTFVKEWDRDKIEKKTKKMLKEIGELQHKMLAQNRFSLLIIFQGIDASGKDGLTKGLLRYCNPIGVEVDSFKKPTEEEYARDFLWRIHKVVPRKGTTHIWIRSHYEDILVPSVLKFIDPEVIDRRYQLITDFERIVEHNETRILKFFLNVSKEVQKERLMERIEIEEKHWKHKDGDWETREKWDEYMAVYERVINTCSEIPWHIVPSDRNWQKLHKVADVVLKTLKSLDLKWPELETEKFRDGI